MSELSHTVFRPQPSMPTRFEPAKVEAAARVVWTKPLRAATRKGQFLLLDGPPYANGDIHMGHALNKVLKDLVVRTKRQRGYDVTWNAFWDCHGLPIEWKVELEQRAAGLTNVDPTDLRKACRSYATENLARQREQFKALGVTANFDAQNSSTMDPVIEADIMGIFHDLVVAGKVYRANKPVMWSYVEGTAMAEAEAEQRVHNVNTVWVKFPILSGALTGTNLLVWTTTPWSLPGNAAVVYSRDITYGLYTFEGQNYVIADSAAEATFGDAATRVWDVNSEQLDSMTVQSPFSPTTTNPVFHADFVSEGTGTGLVHLGPSHSMEDWAAWQKQFPDADYLRPVGKDGCFKPDVPHVGGMPVVKNKRYGEGNDRVVEVLKAVGALVREEVRELTLNHSWRSEALLYVIDTPQWFLDVEEARQQSLRGIKFIPESGGNRLESMLRNRPDWVVSRQRRWGTPLGLFVNANGEPLLDTEVLQKSFDVVREGGSEAWWTTPTEELLCGYSPKDYTRVDDVLDVWFDSGAMIHIDGRVPDMLIEGTDQSRGWFQSLLVLHALSGHPFEPYKNVITHGFVVTKNREKMAKRSGNGLSPSVIAEKYGTDVLRMWVAASDYTQDIALDEEVLKGVVEQHRKIRNTLRYLVGALEGYDPTVEHDEEPAIERRARYQLQCFILKMEAAVERYDFAAYTRELNRYCVEDLSNFLFEVRKDILYCDSLKSGRRNAYLYRLNEIFEWMIAYATPLMPFTAEEVMTAKGDGRSAASLEVPDFVPEPFDLEWEKRWDAIMALRDLIFHDMEEARKAGTIKSSLDTVVFIKDPPAPFEVMEEVLITSKAGGLLMTSAPVGHMVVKATEDGLVKCPRCWKHAELEEDGLCMRCSIVVEG